MAAATQNTNIQTGH